MQRHDHTHSATTSHVLLCHTVDIPWIKCRERTWRVTTSGSQISGRAVTLSVTCCATPPKSNKKCRQKLIQRAATSRAEQSMKQKGGGADSIQPCLAAAISHIPQYCEPLAPLHRPRHWDPHSERGILLESCEGQVQTHERRP